MVFLSSTLVQLPLHNSTQMTQNYQTPFPKNPNLMRFTDLHPSPQANQARTPHSVLNNLGVLQKMSENSKYHLCYEIFHLFAKDRNHIMHNKLIDRTAYLQINNLTETIEKDLVLAINRLNETILSVYVFCYECGEELRLSRFLRELFPQFCNFFSQFCNLLCLLRTFQ